MGEIKLAYQTIIFGQRLNNIEQKLEIIANAGFTGVEIAQSTDQLFRQNGAPVRTCAELIDLLEPFGLELVGLAGGPLRARQKFCGDFKSSYLYVENGDGLEDAIGDGFTLALHPHHSKAIHTSEEAASLLDKYPKLKWLPDTAHLYIACIGKEGRPDSNRSLLQNYDRDEAFIKSLDLFRAYAIHLQDWSPAYGTTYCRFSRGFTELGRGVVCLEKVLKKLNESKVTSARWLVVEQDRTDTDPATSVFNSAQWLRENTKKYKVYPKNVQKRSDNPTLTDDGNLSEMERRFTPALIRASSQSPATCYETIVSKIKELVGCDLAAMWAYNDEHKTITLLSETSNNPAFWNGCEWLDKTEIDDTICKYAIDNQTVVELQAPDWARSRGSVLSESVVSKTHDILNDLGMQHVVAVPISDPSNFNIIRYVLTLFTRNEAVNTSDEVLMSIGRNIARVADSALDARCSSAAAEANYQAGEANRRQDFDDRKKDVALQIAKVIQRSVLCEGCSVFFENSTGDRLELMGTTGFTSRVKDMPPSQFYYETGEGCTGVAWAENRVKLTKDSTKLAWWKGKSTERVLSPSRKACLYVPISNLQGKTLGLVRCRNKNTDQYGRNHMFSDDDIAIVDAVNRAVIPHLEVVMAEELSSYTEIAEHIQECKSLHALYTYCTVGLPRAFNCEHASIYTKTTDTIGNTKIILRKSSYPECKAKENDDYYLPGKNGEKTPLTSFVFTKKAPLRVQNLKSGPELAEQLSRIDPGLYWRNQLQESEEYLSLLAVPIMSASIADDCIGVLRFTGKPKGEGEKLAGGKFTESDQIRLERIAREYIAPRIERLVRGESSDLVLFTEARDYINTLSLEEQASSTDLATSVCDLLQRCFNFDEPTKNVYLVNILEPNRQRFRNHAISGELQTSLGRSNEIYNLEGTLTGYVVNSMKPAFIVDTEAAGQSRLLNPVVTEAKCMLAAPILFRQKVFGAVIVGSDHYDIIPEVHGPLLSIIANRVGEMYQRRKNRNYVSSINGQRHDTLGILAAINGKVLDCLWGRAETEKALLAVSDLITCATLTVDAHSRQATVDPIDFSEKCLSTDIRRSLESAKTAALAVTDMHFPIYIEASYGLEACIFEPFLVSIAFNLIKNALASIGFKSGNIEFPGYSGKIEIYAFLDATGQNEELVVEFSDNGNGIASHKIERYFLGSIFDESQEIGTGVRLSRSLADWHSLPDFRQGYFPPRKGSLVVKASTAGIGSKIVLRLPSLNQR